MSVQIAVRLDERELEELDAAVARGVFANRAAAVRAALRSALDLEREREIEAAYRHAYREAPDKDDRELGELGLALGAAVLRAEPDP